MLQEAEASTSAHVADKAVQGRYISALEVPPYILLPLCIAPCTVMACTHIEVHCPLLVLPMWLTVLNMLPTWASCSTKLHSQSGMQNQQSSAGAQCIWPHRCTPFGILPSGLALYMAKALSVPAQCVCVCVVFISLAEHLTWHCCTCLVCITHGPMV